MISDNELAEAYVTKTLGGVERKAVEKRMENDPPFAQLVLEYENTLEALKRKWLRNNIEVAKKELWVRKLVKIGIGMLVLSALLFIVTYKLLKPKSQKTTGIELNDMPEVSAVSPIKLTDTIKGHDSLPIVQLLKKEPMVNYAHKKDSILKYNESSILKTVVVEQDYFSAMSANQLMANTYQVFEIDPRKDNEVKCEHGTLINLPANAMELTNGKAPQGMVTLSVQEYSDYAEMFKHHVTTTADFKLLETGGSCFIKAEANGDSVVLKKNQSYTISFPSEKDERMKTFMGERDSNGNLNWVLDEPEVKKIHGKAIPVNKVPVVNRAVGEACDCNTEHYYFQTVVSDEGFYNSKTDDYTYNVLSTSKKVVSMFDTFKNIASKEIKLLYKQNSRLRLRFGVDSLGHFTSFDYNFKIEKKTEKALKAAAEYIITKHQIELNNRGAKNVIVNVDLVPSLEILNTQANEELQSIDSVAPAEVKNKINRGNMNIIVARHFGYINCDFFSNQQNLTKLEVQIPSDHTEVNVFFKNIKAVAHCASMNGVASLTNAPLAASVLIVGTVIKNNQLMMALKEAKVGEPIELSNLEPFDLNKITAFLTSQP